MQKAQLAKRSESLENEIGILHGNKAWEEAAPRIHANDPQDPVKAAYWAKRNNRIYVLQQESLIADFAEKLRADIMLVMGDNYQLRDDYELKAHPVRRARVFMRFLEHACTKKYYEEKAELEKQKQTWHKNDSAIEIGTAEERPNMFDAGR